MQSLYTNDIETTQMESYSRVNINNKPKYFNISRKILTTLCLQAKHNIYIAISYRMLPW